jgi:hypothetical protein
MSFEGYGRRWGKSAAWPLAYVGCFGACGDCRREDTHMIDKILPWLEDQMKRGNFEGVRLEQLDDDRNTAQPVNEWALKEDEDLPQLAANIDDTVFGDANVYGGNKYQLVAIANGKVRARLGIQAKVPEKAIQRGSAGRQYGDESAALLEQTYRHNEALMRAVINISVGNTKSLVSEIDRLHRRYEESERRVESMRETHERSLNTNFDREQKRLKFQSDEKRLDEATTTVRTLLPFIINAAAKRQMVPTGDSSVLAEAMRPAMESLTSEQLDQLREVLTPPQLIALLEVWQLLCAEKPKDKN